MIGLRFNRWTVIGESRMVGKQRWWPCRCDCGTERDVRADRLTGNGTKSCGCLWAQQHSKHGHAARVGKSGEYSSWGAMRARCENPKHKHFPYYGGRGVRVCERWQRFENFLADMGPRPTRGHTLDRIKQDGDYEPGNVRWANQSEQRRNRTDVRNLTAFGRTQCVADWASETGLSASTITGRLRKGWSVEKALSEPASASHQHNAHKSRAAA